MRFFGMRQKAATRFAYWMMVVGVIGLVFGVRHLALDFFQSREPAMLNIPNEFHCEALSEQKGFMGLSAVTSPLSPHVKWDFIINYLEDHWNVPCALKGTNLSCWWVENNARLANYNLSVDFSALQSLEPRLEITNRFFKGSISIQDKMGGFIQNKLPIICYSQD